jgi:hypothetical protein
MSTVEQNTEAPPPTPPHDNFDFCRLANNLLNGCVRCVRSLPGMLNRFHGLLTAIATLLLAAIAWMQWVALDSTDKTLAKAVTNGQRAYLIFNNAKIVDLTSPQGIMFSYVIENLGVTPAYELRQRVYIGMRQPPVTNYDGIQWYMTPDVLYVGKTITVRRLDGPLYTKERINSGSIRSQNERLYFIGRTDYRDVFGNERWTDFCFMYVDPDAAMNLSNCDYLNEADQIGKTRRP